MTAPSESLRSCLALLFLRENASGRPKVSVGHRRVTQLIAVERQAFGVVACPGGKETDMSRPSDKPSGQPVGGQWAKQQKKGMEKQQSANQSNTGQQGGQPSNQGNQQQQAGQGDERKPDQPIGEVVYADRDPAKKKTGEF
jgi:hypothetical protein